MTYAVQFHAPAAKELSKLDRQLQLRITGVIELLRIDPRPPGAKMLRGGERGRWRVRVGDYRIVYAVDDGRLLVLVLRVAHRSEVYGRLPESGTLGSGAENDESGPTGWSDPSRSRKLSSSGPRERESRRARS